MFQKNLEGPSNKIMLKTINLLKGKLEKQQEKWVNRLGTLVVCDVAWSLLQQNEKWDINLELFVLEPLPHKEMESLLKKNEMNINLRTFSC